MEEFEKQRSTAAFPAQRTTEASEDELTLQDDLEQEQPEEVTPTTPVPSADERTNICGAAEFAKEAFLRKGKVVTVCRNQETGKFAKALCCK